MNQETSKLLKEKTSEEDLLWVIQNDLPETTINEWKEDDIKKEENHLFKLLHRRVIFKITNMTP